MGGWVYRAKAVTASAQLLLHIHLLSALVNTFLLLYHLQVFIIIIILKCTEMNNIELQNDNSDIVVSRLELGELPACQDDDECAEDNGGCQDDCINTLGGHRSDMSQCHTLIICNIKYIEYIEYNLPIFKILH